MSKWNYQDAVLEGVALLDTKEPGWANRIDTERLSMGSCTQCVLGQLYGNYGFGLKELRLSWGLSPHTRSAVRFGFVPNCDLLEDFHPDAVYLRDLWIEQIRERRSR